MRAEMLASTTRSPLRGAARPPGAMTHRSISPISPYFSATGRKLPGRMTLAVATDHPQQQLLARAAAGQGHDRLRVQDEAVLVDGVADPADPGERVELATQRAPAPWPPR